MVSVSIKEITRGDSALRRLTRNLSDGFDEAMREIAELLHSEAMESFRAERDPWGAPWKPHSDTTLALRRRGSGSTSAGGFGAGGFAGDALLKRSGALRGGLVPRHSGSKASVALTGPAAAYGAVHQLGNPENKLPNRAGGNPAPIPARPFLPLRERGGGLEVALPDEVREEIVDIMRRALTRGGR